MRKSTAYYNLSVLSDYFNKHERLNEQQLEDARNAFIYIQKQLKKEQQLNNVKEAIAYILNQLKEDV